MKHVKELLLGLLTSLATALIVLGALSISITEGMVFVPTQVLIPTASPMDFDLTTLLPQQSRTPTATPSDYIITATSPAYKTCNYPRKWQPYTIEVGDTLKALAKQFNISLQELKDANCLVSDELVPGTDIYVPPLQPTATQKLTRTAEPTPTKTRRPTSTSYQCGPPAGWIAYRIQPGENLFRIGLRYNVTAEELRRVNCLASSDRIIAGTIIYVPNVPTIAPTSTRTPVPPTNAPKPTKAPTRTTAPSATIPASTNTTVPSPTVSPTASPTTIPTATLANTLTATTVPSETLVPTNTESPAPSETIPTP